MTAPLADVVIPVNLSFTNLNEVALLTAPNRDCVNRRESTVGSISVTHAPITSSLIQSHSSRASSPDSHSVACPSAKRACMKDLASRSPDSPNAQRRNGRRSYPWSIPVSAGRVSASSACSASAVGDNASRPGSLEPE